MTDLVIIFDNEVKDDPAFPTRYKPDPDNQWDTQVYAQYSLRLLRPELAAVGGTVRVGQLPDELRVDGKADFDGILAACVAKHGMERGTKEARAIFRKAIAEASGTPARDLFPSRAQRIIESKVEAMFRVPHVLSGGKREMKLMRRFRMLDTAPMSLVEDEDDEVEGTEKKKPAPTIVDKALADAFSSVIGCYYVRKLPDKDRRAVLIKDVAGLNRLISSVAEKLKTKPPEAEAAPLRQRLTILYSRLAATWERIHGMPVPISTFTLKCEYMLKSNGMAILLVRVTRFRTNRFITEKSTRHLTRDDLARLADFRKWCGGIGDAVFGGDDGGDKDLQKLHKDLNAQCYLREIQEVNVYGWHKETDMWLYDDCAFPKKAPIILADDNGIFWNEGMGYQVTGASTGDDGAAEFFCQGAPKLLSPQEKGAHAGNPDWIKAVRLAIVEAGPKEHRDLLTLADTMLNEMEMPDAVKLIDKAPAALQPALRKALTAAIFAHLCEDIFNTVGDYDGWVAVALQLAYAIGPDLCKIGGHPGSWLTGKMSSGKTTIGRWLMYPWGFKELGGIKLGEKSSSSVGLNRGLGQYSSLPCCSTNTGATPSTPRRRKPCAAPSTGAAGSRAWPPATTGRATRSPRRRR